MKLDFLVGEVPVFHSVREDFGDLLRMALRDEKAVAALGPLYEDDPAADLLRPFVRSMHETGWAVHAEGMLAPDEVLARAKVLRDEVGAKINWSSAQDLIEWTRAGLVLEIARRRGVRFAGRGLIHFDWKMRGTVTGRFGCETHRSVGGWSANPLTLNIDERRRIVASDAVRSVVVLDFKAMDVCSMTAIVPGLGEIMEGHPDPYSRVAELTGLSRDKAKLSFLTWAYGGVVEPYILDELWRCFRPISDFTKHLDHGQFPRMVQTVSAQAFRAGLSMALPKLVGELWIPMFCVHDELALDTSEWGLDRIKEVQSALEIGASQTIGAPYRVGVSAGYTYEEAKNG